LERNIVLTGYRRDVSALMQLMDVVVHASITPEPFGMVLIEAMAMNKPIVATKMGGPLDIVEDGQSGILVLPGDAGEMAGAIITLLTDKELAEKWDAMEEAALSSYLLKNGTRAKWKRYMPNFSI
jgi:glycosyltransferase involved in cell wall biosynthesis